MAGLFKVLVEDNQLRVLMDRSRLNLNTAQLSHLGLAIRDSAAKVQARAVRNVSGYPVQYDGQAFRVVPRTGTLKGAIDMQYPFQEPMQARVFVNGAHTSVPMPMGGGFVMKPVPVSRYAAAIEYGHEPIDLKQYMLGKTVPFFASRSKSSTGPYTARGLTPVAGTDTTFENKVLNARLQARGKGPMHFERKGGKSAYASGGAGAYFIAFRKVGKTGWIIPAAKARPFMRAALRQSQADTRRFVSERLVEVLSDGLTGH